MSEVSAQAGALESSAKLVAAARADLDKQCDGLREQLSQLKDNWRGAAALAFTELLEQWEDQTRRTIAALDDFESKLRATDRAHVRVDQEVHDAGKRLSARLG
ncbi:WXG100 family type VII secretion target [Sporichthya polymorpha]|uniref:WXG100 family type VII secretion target n=1 Tax=Sporichthya polymorpha TaxID=35751 RepID=UPI00146DB2AE|nr:WXG100 family type VII secretion target [Sporichthya polymorpha]